MLVFRELTLMEVFFRIFLAVLIGSILGLERGRHNRPVGFRTYVLICLGSTIVMMTNQYVFEYFGASDPVRMGAQVVSGIGFLGAGTIIVTGQHQIKGITTSAGMWTAACCGLAIGCGFYEAALLGGVILLVLLIAMIKLDKVVREHASIMDLYIEYDGQQPLSAYLTTLRDCDIDIIDLQMIGVSQLHCGQQCAIITVESKKRQKPGEILQEAKRIPGIVYVEEM